VYVQGLLAAGLSLGFRATALNFRSCARDPRELSRMLPNRRPRLYHSGETEDLDFVVRTLAAREPESPIAVAGVSLGGNVLLKWLGERGAGSGVAAAAALSAPFDLAASARHLETPVGRIYVRSFLATLNPKAQSVAARFPGAARRMDLTRAALARSFWEFDETATAPLHGFAGAGDYYEKSSSIRFLSRIATPTLCLSAADDPFLPPDVFERARAVASPSVEFLLVPRGGHIGFVSGVAPWRAVYWAETLAVEWLARRVASKKEKPGSGAPPPGP
jgi:predicted alpha/beta-fold hydrolase